MVNLTRKWKDGKLEAGLYYVKYKDGRCGKSVLISKPYFYGFYSNCSLNDEIAKVLDRVPDYDDWVYLCNTRRDALYSRDILTQREKLLKRLLSECYAVLEQKTTEKDKKALSLLYELQGFYSMELKGK